MNNSSIVGISVLSAIFFGSLITLVIVLRKRLGKSLQLISEHYEQEHGSSAMLVERMETCCDEGEGGYDNMGIGDNIYQDEQWTSNVVELVPHCLGILKSSQLLTEEVIKAVVTKEENRGKNDAMALVTAGHMITSHVDAVVKALYPPLDLGLLEARCCTLVLSVSNLVVATKHLTNFSNDRSFDPLLHDLYSHLKFMKSNGESLEKVSPPSSNHNPHHPPSKKIKTILRDIKENDEDDDELINIENNNNNTNNINNSEGINITFEKGKGNNGMSLKFKNSKYPQASIF